MKKLTKILSILGICSLVIIMASCSKPGKSEDVTNNTAGAPLGTSQSEVKPISLDEAIEIAVKDAGISRENAVFDDVKRENENGVTYYEIEFACGDKEYEYKIDISTGTVIEKDTDGIKPENTTANENVTVSSTEATTEKQNGYIGVDKAKAIALKDAGVVEDKVILKVAILDTDDSVIHYDIEYIYDGFKYDYEIDAKTGAVLDKEKEAEVSVKPTASTTLADENGEYISVKEAKQIVLSHANLKESDLKEISVKLDKEDVIVHYDIDFETADYDYDYKINAKTGAIISSDKDKILITTKPIVKGDFISAEKAKEIAFNNAKTDSSKVSKLKVNFENTLLRPHYDVKFVLDGYEYEYEIDAKTGEIFDIDTETV